MHCPQINYPMLFPPAHYVKSAYHSLHDCHLIKFTHFNAPTIISQALVRHIKKAGIFSYNIKQCTPAYVHRNLLWLFFSRFPVSYKAVAQTLLPSFKSVTLYSLLLSLLRSQKHFNTMYDMTKPKHTITVASELKKLSRAVTMPPVSTVTNIHSAKSLRNGIFLPACLPIASLAASGTTTRTEVHL